MIFNNVITNLKNKYSFFNHKKIIIHKLSLTSIGGIQKSFSKYFFYALKKSFFYHHIYGVHEVSKDFFILKKYYVNLNKSLFLKIKFVYLLFSKKYIIHFYNNLGSVKIQKLLKFFPSSNIIFHERGSAWNAQDKHIEIFKFNASKAKIIIANSNAAKIMLIKRFGINKKKIEVVYNGFLNKEENYIPKKLNRFSNKLSVGFIGRFDTPKGVHTFIYSAMNLPQYDFFIAGAGILENELKKLAKNHKNIYFLGSVRNPLEFIHKMDIIVVPSLREPLGNVIIEAGYCKKPVIASNIDGIPEIIKDGVSGILINPDKKVSNSKLVIGTVPVSKVVINPKTQKLQKPLELNPLKICESIIFLDLNHNIRKLYGENLYNTVKEKFNIENYHNFMEDIYKRF